MKVHLLRIRKLSFILVLILFTPVFVQGQSTNSAWVQGNLEGVSSSIRFSKPVLFPFTTNTNLDLFLGHDVGPIIHQINVGTNKTDLKFNPPESGLFSQVFSRSSPSIGDYNGDGLTDLIVGVADGSLHLLIQNSKTKNFESNDSLVSTIKVDGHSAPAMVDYNSDGLMDIIVGSENGTLAVYLNKGTVLLPTWELQINALKFPMGTFLSPTIVPVGKSFDIIVGSRSSGLSYLKNTDTSGSSPKFDLIPFQNQGSPFRNLKFSTNAYITPFILDIDGNGFMDLLVGQESGGVSLYYNNNIDFAKVNSVADNSLLIWIIGVLLLIIFAGVGFIVYSRYFKRGKPVYLMIMNSNGGASHTYKFTEEVVTDSVLAGGAFSGIQALIQEITMNPLESFEAGEYKIIISRKEINEHYSINIFLWATADDPQLRGLSEKLLEKISKSLADEFELGFFKDKDFDLMDSYIEGTFQKWVK